MDIIKFNTTLKASGKDYTKIVFWNRFIRNPIELILSWTPAIISLVLLSLHYYSSFLLILYAVCWFYPIYIFAYQFRSSVNYHLKHRDPSEEAPCTITLMDNAIMADIPEHDLVYTYEWNQFTNVQALQIWPFCKSYILDKIRCFLFLFFTDFVIISAMNWNL